MAQLVDNIMGTHSLLLTTYELNILEIIISSEINSVEFEEDWQEWAKEAVRSIYGAIEAS